MKENSKEMTIDQLTISMFNSISYPITESEYRILGISRFNILKRRRFRNIYGTLLLYLIKLSIPGAFPEHSSRLLEAFHTWFQMAYKGNQNARHRIEERLTKFEELTEMHQEQPFLSLALHISEMFEQRSRKLVYAAELNDHIETLFLNFLTVGRKVKIKAK